jgi:hypothetical protein
MDGIQLKRWEVGVSWGLSITMDVFAEDEKMAEREALQRLRDTAARLNLSGVWGQTVDVDFVKEDIR